jgi:hypothetical protein
MVITIVVKYNTGKDRGYMSIWVNFFFLKKDQNDIVLSIFLFKKYQQGLGSSFVSASFKLIRPVGQFEFFIGLDEYFTFLYFFFNLDQFRLQVNLSERSEQKNKKKPIVSRKQKKN